MLKSTCNFLVEPDMKIVLGDTKQAFAISLLVGKKKKGGGWKKCLKDREKPMKLLQALFPRITITMTTFSKITPGEIAGKLNKSFQITVRFV